MQESYKAGSLSLAVAVAIGTGVMVGAGIFALTGQIAEFAGPLFPLAFLLAVGLILVAFLINIAGNKFIGVVSKAGLTATSVGFVSLLLLLLSACAPTLKLQMASYRQRG